jgi:hypothetical protein
MSQLSDIIQITISRETQAIARASFGTPAIVSEFAASKTLTTFDRYREYASVTEMLNDNWLSTDKEYLRANKIFSQNPKPTKVVIGRKNTPTELVETWTQALTAIQVATQDWYAFTIDATGKATVTFDIDFVSSNSIVATVNGIVCDPVVYATGQENTMNLLKAEIEGHAGLTDTIVTIGASPFRTMTIEKESGDITSVSIVTTGGVTQPVATVVYTEHDDILEAAAWAETQKKIFFLTDNDATIITAGTSDIAYQLKALNYDRSCTSYHPNLVTADQFLAEAWIGKMLPKDPGSASWMFKNLSGITAVGLNSSERTFALNKNCNIYTTTAGVAITENGKVASGEYIDIIRGIDWLESTIQETIYAELINVDKVPYTDEGIAIIEGLLKEALDEGVREQVIASYTTTVPAVADISSQDKIARTLPDVEFTAILSGAIHYIQISGVVTV